MQCRSPYNRNVKAHCISQSGLSSEKTLAVVWLTNVVVISQRSILAFFLLTFLINLDFLSFSISFLSTDFLSIAVQCCLSVGLFSIDVES